MKKKIIINGLNRIGKLCLFHLIKSDNFKIAGLFCNASPEDVVAFLKNDSNHGKFWGEAVSIEKNSKHNHIIKFVFADQTTFELNLFDSKVFDSKVVEKINPDILLNFEKNVKNPTLEKWTKLVKKFVITGINDQKVQKKEFEPVVYGVNHTKILQQKQQIIFVHEIETTIIVNLLKRLSAHLHIETCYFQIITSLNNQNFFLDDFHSKRGSGYFVRSALNNITTNPINNTLVKSINQTLTKLRFFGNTSMIVGGEKVTVPVNGGAYLTLNLNMQKIHDQKELEKIIHEIASDSLITINAGSPLASQDIVSTPHFAVIDHSLNDFSLMTAHAKTLKLSLWYDPESSYAMSFFKTLEFIAN